MAKNFIKPRLNRLFVDAVEGLITDLSKRNKFQVVTQSKVTCPNCIVDSTNKSGTGRYNGTGPTPFSTKVCPVCENKGSIVTTTPLTITANVQVASTDGASTTYVPFPEGKLAPGTARVKTFARFKSLCDGAAYFLINGTRYSRLTNPESRGLQTLVTCFFFVKKDE